MRTRALLLVLTFGLLEGCARLRSRPPSDPAFEAADVFLQAWERGDVPAELLSSFRPFRDTLHLVRSRFQLLGVDHRGSEAIARFRVEHVLGGLGPWAYENQFTLQFMNGRWQVRLNASLLHPAGRDGDRFVRIRTRPARAPLLDGKGRPLTVDSEEVTVGLDPPRVQDRRALAAALEQQLGLAASRVDHAMSGTATHFNPLIDLTPERYQQVRSTLAPIPGVFFKRHTLRQLPSEGFAAVTLGRTGEITAELISRLGPLYQAGDTVGLSGLELAYEASLAGTPSGEIRVVHHSGEVQGVARFEGKEGVAIQTTLIPEVQQAAEVALEGVALPAAIVAVDSETGAILAVSSHPIGEAFNRALTGLYPPGSTFKVVTSEALLGKGMSAESMVSCPPKVSVGGKTFKNFEGESFDRAPLRTAFALSCNTAFVSLSSGITSRELLDSAGRFGFGVDYQIGLPSPGGVFPLPLDAAEQASASIGQGRVRATPLHMASVAAAADSGRWRAPYLIAAYRGGPNATLAGRSREALHTLMRSVVSEGTGRAAATVPGLSGKTGTAEFGTATPLQTHAWFIGFVHGVAFAVLVEGGGTGGKVAGPIAARFASAWFATGR